MNKENQGQGMVSVGYSPCSKLLKRFEKLSKEELLNLICEIKDIPEDVGSPYHKGRRQGLGEGLESLKRLVINFRGGNNNE